MYRKQFPKILFYAFLTALMICWLFPLLFIALAAIKSPDEFFSKPMLSLPGSISLNNFFRAWKDASLGRYMMNGMIVSFLKVPLGIFLESITAFALARLSLKKADGMFMFFLIGMMIPMQVTLVGLNYAFSRLGLTNTYFGLFYVYVGFGIPFGILVMRGFFRAVPHEMDEAARIDGC